jgi:hypothetical protein
MKQVFFCINYAIKARKKNCIDIEIQQCINIYLLLGITLEGVINEICEKELDTWSWKELEKTSTPLKWKYISSLKTSFEPSREPLQTIQKIYRIRNRIAHPKLEELSNDTILITNSGKIYKNMADNFKLPRGTVYGNYGDYISEFNAYSTLISIKKALSAINIINKMFYTKNIDNWCEYFNNEIKNIQVEKNELN